MYLSCMTGCCKVKKDWTQLVHINIVSNSCHFVVKTLDICSLGILKNTVNWDVEMAH